MNKVKTEIKSRSLRKEIADLDKKIKKITGQKEILNRKLDELRKDSGDFTITNWNSVGISLDQEISTTLQFDTLSGQRLNVKEIWLNDRIYIDALGVHNLDEKEGS